MPIDRARLSVEIGFILAHAATAHEYECELQVRKPDRYRATSEYLIKDVDRAPVCQWDRHEHRRHCRHDERPENVLGRPDRSPRARVKPKAALCVEHEIKENPYRVRRDLAGLSRKRKFEFISLQRQVRRKLDPTVLIRASKRWRPDWTAMRANELPLWFAEARRIRRSIAPTRSSAAAKTLGITTIHPFMRRRGYRVSQANIAVRDLGSGSTIAAV